MNEHIAKIDDPEVASDITAATEALAILSSDRDPQLARQLARLVTVIALEATRSSRLTKALATALDTNSELEDSPTKARSVRRPHRRTPGVLDPFAVYADLGEQGLRERLAELNLDQLRDIIAEHQMDHDRLAMKWKDTGRVIDRIAERVLARTAKGAAFR
jgi:hypothetical protein